MVGGGAFRNCVIPAALKGRGGAKNLHREASDGCGAGMRGVHPMQGAKTMTRFNR